jgi:DNA-binding NtrC family response regulator
LFLDEVGDLPLEAQAKLLRVLEDGLVRPVGGETEQRVDVRVLSATNRDLEQAVRDKTFRADLLARLSAVEARTPPLRNRPEDLPALIGFLRARGGHPTVAIDADSLEAMSLYAWPQNIRELDNVMRQVALHATSELAFPQLPERIQNVLTQARRTADSEPRSQPSNRRAELETALRAHRGNVRRASASLKIARSHVYRLIKQWDLDLEKFRSDPKSI